MFGTMQVLCYRQVSSVTITNEFLAPDNKLVESTGGIEGQKQAIPASFGV